MPGCTAILLCIKKGLPFLFIQTERIPFKEENDFITVFRILHSSLLIIKADTFIGRHTASDDTLCLARDFAEEWNVAVHRTYPFKLRNGLSVSDVRLSFCLKPNLDKIFIHPAKLLTKQIKFKQFVVYIPVLLAGACCLSLKNELYDP